MPASAARREAAPSADPTPEFFGAGDSHLFGIHHPALGPSHSAVLLCPPLGQEALRTHRAYRLLAEALASRGCDVLRFDYAGTGDSAGDGRSVTWDGCIADIVLAADHLRGLAPGARLIAFGARLGASLALCAEAAHFREIICWDPVFDGAPYVESMDRLHAAMCRDTQRFAIARETTGMDDEWLGFPVSPALRAALCGLHLRATQQPLRILASADAGALLAWQASGVRPGSLQVLHESTPWDSLDRIETAILPHALIKAVAALFESAAR